MTDRFSADDLSRRSRDAVRAIDLAHTAPFKMGEVEVRPASRTLLRGERIELVEPLVMQVLVALHSARGTTLSRDDLIDACWGGRAVSDDAISRVVSRLRALGKSLGGFAVETMPKIGYRLVEDDHTREAAAGRGLDRRTIVAGSAAAAVAVAGAGLLWRRPWRHRPAPEAEQLYLRGRALSREGMPGQAQQTVSYFERAVSVDPDFADAWGALALAYSHLLQGFDNGEVASLPLRLQSAAKRALELDPRNADARLARIFATPFFGNWAAKEEALRQVVSRHPDHWLARGRLGVLMYEVGRQSEGIALHRQALEIEPMLPIAYYFLITNLSALGRAHEAEALIERGGKQWPAHPALWVATFDHYLTSGRHRAASALLADQERLPVGFSAAQVEPRRQLVRAAETRDPAAVAASVSHYRQQAEENAEAIETAAPIFAFLGHAELAFSSLERYFFNRGQFGGDAPKGRYDQRRCAFLFGKGMAHARNHPRFAVLLREVGLEEYWRKTGTLPDFRRG